MATSFSRTLRSLEQIRPRARWVVLLLIVLAAWGAWMGLAAVPVYEVTEQARLEVSRAAHPLAASVPGRVVRSELQLGRTVVEGDVLVELDATDATLAVREKNARITSLESRRVALDKEIDAECGRNAGLRTIRVRTGFDKMTDGSRADWVAEDLKHAADIVLDATR